MIDTGTSDKIGPTLTVKLLKECSPGELVRLQTIGAWAIVANDPELKDKRIFVIAGPDAPRTFLLEDSDWVCLSYGVGFQMLPMHATFVAMHTYGAREEFTPVGMLIYSRAFEPGGRTRRYFAGITSTRVVRYLDLDDFRAQSEPLGYRAVFQDWEVSMCWPGQREMITLAKSGK